MGYGIVVWCDDRAVRRLIASGGDRAAETVGGDLAAVLGADPYPTGGVPAHRAGPFAAVGAWPAHRRVIVAVDGRSAAVADVAGLGATHDGYDESVWVAQLGPGAMAARERAAMASPATYQQALAQGRSATDVLFGPNQVAGASTASLWWFYADALAGGPPDPTTLGQGVISLVDTHLGAAVNVGRHLNALNKAGRSSATAARCSSGPATSSVFSQTSRPEGLPAGVDNSREQPQRLPGRQDPRLRTALRDLRVPARQPHAPRTRPSRRHGGGGRANESAIICHSTLYQAGVDNAVCRGFYDRHPTQPLQIAQRLGLVEFDRAVPDDTAAASPTKGRGRSPRPTTDRD